MATRQHKELTAKAMSGSSLPWAARIRECLLRTPTTSAGRLSLTRSPASLTIHHRRSNPPDSQFEDGWFLSDFYAFNYLLKGSVADQVWLTAAEPSKFVEEAWPPSFISIDLLHQDG
ncbi:hypothetical protein B0H66DRAFT_536104 [Apodospora peruviana]|uniref:Uncharacterized protein n=1 Tax=Apodospora peruviana TaxID=516989 RepID=A0AAE0I0B1_9PEZI|nr:hypothetical protein B0H66DRAFT_536104 [Apodospora peruviana]